MLRTIDLIHQLDSWTFQLSLLPLSDEEKEALRVIRYRLQAFDGLLAVCRQVKTAVEATDFFENETK